MASKSLIFLCVFLVSLVIVSQGVLAARELAETVQVNGDGKKIGPGGRRGAGAVAAYSGGWQGSYGGGWGGTYGSRP